MKNLFLILLLTFCSIGVFSQEDRLPEYPGGEKAFKEYLKKGLALPKNMSENHSFSFKVNKDGSIDRFSLSELKSEALRNKISKRLEDMPKWNIKDMDYDADGLEIEVTLSSSPKGVDINFNKEFIYLISIATVRGDEDAIDIAEIKEHRVIVEESAPKEKPFVSVEQMPQFPGGQVEMNKYISENLQYPKVAKDNGIQGRVVLRFVVDKDGSISDVQVVRSLDPSCDKEAVRVIKSMPKWNPGKQNGREVPVYFTLPVTFKIH